MKDALTFLKKILLLLVLFCLLDYVCGKGLKQLFYKQKSGKYYTIFYCFENAKEDVMIFGDSHANEQFNAPLMEEKLKLSTFNFGSQGQSFLYQYPLIKTVVQRHKPKLVIITLNYNSLKYSKDDYQRLSVFLPFGGENPYIDSAIASVGKNELYKSYSSFYKYNSTLGYMLLNTYKKSYNKSYESRGYDPTPGTICSKIEDFEKINAQNAKKKNEFKIDSVKLNYYINIMDELKAKNINTIFIATPLYNFPTINADLYFIELKKLLASKGATFWNLAIDSNFTKKCELYHDPSHLNEVGATKFTEYIIEKIKPVLQ